MAFRQKACSSSLSTHPLHFAALQPEHTKIPVARQSALPPKNSPTPAHPSPSNSLAKMRQIPRPISTQPPNIGERHCPQKLAAVAHNQPQCPSVPNAPAAVHSLPHPAGRQPRQAASQHHRSFVCSSANSTAESSSKVRRQAFPLPADHTFPPSDKFGQWVLAKNGTLGSPELADQSQFLQRTLYKTNHCCCVNVGVVGGPGLELLL